MDLISCDPWRARTQVSEGGERTDEGKVQANVRGVQRQQAQEGDRKVELKGDRRVIEVRDISLVDIGDEEEGKNVQSNEGFFSEYSKKQGYEEQGWNQLHNNKVVEAVHGNIEVSMVIA